MESDLFSATGVASAIPVCVYKITNLLTDGFYIGVTRKGAVARFAMHWKASKREDSVLYRAMRKYGREAFKIEVLESVADPSLLFELERRYIADNRSFVGDEAGGYNMTRGGEGSPEICELVRANMRAAARSRMARPEIKAKISAALKGRPLHPASAAALLRNAKNNRGRPLSAEHRRNVSAGQRGKIVTLEQREKISAALTGIKHSSERKRKAAAAMVGRKVSPETRLKISASHMSPETRAKKSAATRASWKGPQSHVRLAAIREGSRRRWARWRASRDVFSPGGTEG